MEDSTNGIAIMGLNGSGNRRIISLDGSKAVKDNINLILNALGSIEG